MSKEIASKDQGLVQVKAELGSTAQEREKWIGDTRYALFPRLQNWFPEIAFPGEYPAAPALEEEPILDPAAQDTLMQLLSTVESLQQSLTQNELEIRTRAGNIKRAYEQLAEIEAAVVQVDQDWRNAPLPTDTAEVILTARARQKNETVYLDEDYQLVHDSFIRAQTILENLQKDLRKSEKAIKEKHERAVEIWHDPLDQKEEEISRRFRENEQLLNSCKQALSVMDQWIQTLVSQSKIMDTHVEGRVQLRDVPEELQQQVKDNCEPLVSDWLLRSRKAAASGRKSPVR